MSFFKNKTIDEHTDKNTFNVLLYPYDDSVNSSFDRRSTDKNADKVPSYLCVRPVDSSFPV